jgi:hypothetical protein
MTVSPAAFAELIARTATPAHLATPDTEPDADRFMAVTTELGDVVLGPPRLLWGGPVEADRVLAFPDAIFAIAITLLTLNLQVPPGLHGADFTRALHQTLPALGAYVLSFVILGQLWLAHHRIFGVIARVDYAILVRNCCSSA